MKTSQKLLIASLVGTVFCCAPVLGDHHGDAAPGSESRETLFIEYRDDQAVVEMRRYNSINNELDRRYYMERNFKRVFEKEGWPLDYEFQWYPAKVPDGAKVLHISLKDLRPANRLEIELRIWASLTVDGKKEDFGITRVLHVPSAFPSQSSVERDLNQIYTKAGQRIAKQLKKTLFEEE